MKHPPRLGHALIDQQHADLFHCIENLSALKGKSCNNERIGQFLSTLAAMLSSHFLSEEAVMLELQLPSRVFLAHQQAHQQVLKTLTELYESGLQGKPYDLSDICDKAAAWVNDHVENYDCPLGSYFAE